MVVPKNRDVPLLYLMSVMYQCYSIIIDRGIIAPGRDKEVVYGLNAVDKRYIYQLMSSAQLPGSIFLIPRRKFTLAT